MEAILNTNYTRISDTDFLALSVAISALLSKHPDFPEPWPSIFPNLATLNGSNDRFREACIAASNRDHVKIAEKKTARTEVEEHLFNISRLLETMAGKNHNMLLNTGFSLRRPKTGRSAKAGISLTPPTNLTVRHGDDSGSMFVKCTRQLAAGSYELQISEEVPSAEDWKQQGIYVHCSNMEVKGLEPGKKYSFRIRAIGGKGPGPWSSPVTLMAI
jgi:hypothetical protein